MASPCHFLRQLRIQIWFRIRHFDLLILYWCLNWAHFQAIIDFSSINPQNLKDQKNLCFHKTYYGLLQAESISEYKYLWNFQGIQAQPIPLYTDSFWRFHLHLKHHCKTLGSFSLWSYFSMFCLLFCYQIYNTNDKRSL